MAVLVHLLGADRVPDLQAKTLMLLTRLCVGQPTAVQAFANIGRDAQIPSHGFVHLCHSWGHRFKPITCHMFP